jgi:hypothetical protein
MAWSNYLTEVPIAPTLEAMPAEIANLERVI